MWVYWSLAVRTRFGGWVSMGKPTRTTGECRECGRDLPAGYLCDDCDRLSGWDCIECGRPVGRLQSVWSTDPTICSEECAEKRSEAPA